MTLQTIANLIILISAVIIASKNIYEFFKKPVKTITQSATNTIDDHIVEVLRKELKEYDKNRDTTIMDLIIESVEGVTAETVEAVKEETDNFKKEMESRITVANEELDTYTKMNKQILENMEQLNENMHFLRESQLALLAEEINAIYEKNKKNKVLTKTEYQQFQTLSNFYINMGGNGEIGEKIKEIKSWKQINNKIIIKKEAEA